MDLSFILVNYRGWKRLKQCLDSLQCLTEATFTWEVIVIDNHSGDGQLTEFKIDFPEFSFIENKGNYGFANGCNLGTHHSKGDYLFFLNPDTIVNLDALNQLLKTSKTHPEISILTCRQENENGKDTKPYGLSLSPTTLTGFLRAICRMLNQKLPIQTIDNAIHAIFPDWVSGSAILISREKFSELNGWSEDYWMYYEDMDLCKRARELGGEVAMLTNIKIIHNHGGASRINIPVKVLTKCETLISKHVYISKHFKGIKELSMQFYLVFNTLVVSLIPNILLGLASIFKPSLRVYPKLFLSTTKYYAGALSNKTWISPRSVNLRSKQK